MRDNPNPAEFLFRGFYIHYSNNSLFSALSGVELLNSGIIYLILTFSFHKLLRRCFAVVSVAVIFGILTKILARINCSAVKQGSAF